MDDPKGLKSAACLIAAQLPANASDAIAVLEIAIGIVRHLEAPRPTGEIIPLSCPARSRLAIVAADGQAVRTYPQGISNPG